MALPNMPLQQAIPPQGDRVESGCRLGAGFQLNGKASGQHEPFGKEERMLEKNMRDRIARVLQGYRRRALISAVGIGIGVGGCATAESSSRRESTPRHGGRILVNRAGRSLDFVDRYWSYKLML
jgi:hypothetical protein